jgi:Pyruvate/2-oxoacid:ferredoxin oxidoreductase delta subunit
VEQGIVGKLSIVKHKCPAQQDICQAIAACPRGAIGYIEDAQERFGGRIVFDYDRCDGCGRCVTECCGAAIEMRYPPEQIGEA